MAGVRLGDVVALIFAAIMVVVLFWGGAQHGAGDLFASPYDYFVHVMFFALLGSCVLHGLPRTKSWRVLALLVVVAAADELRQIALPERHASGMDFAMDVIGALGAMVLYPVTRVCLARLQPRRQRVVARRRARSLH